MNIFVSYTIRDGLISVGLLKQIAKQLEGVSKVFIDLLEHRGGGHQPSVWRALQQADAFLLCMTPHVFRSPWVRQEYLEALRLGLPVYRVPRDLRCSVEGGHYILHRSLRARG